MDRRCFGCSAKLADLVVRTSMARRVARGCNLQRKERRTYGEGLDGEGNEDSRFGTLKRMRRSSGGHSEQRRPSVMSDGSSPEQQSPERVIGEIGPEAGELKLLRRRNGVETEQSGGNSVWKHHQR
ncbi:hypothetical protein Rs2_40965 [Raphanus sativus]|nr:hypothetical protein Rs2_40965 [Raphanus sativus]